MENNKCKQNNQVNKSKHKRLVVIESNAAAQNIAMMIHFPNALFTFAAMMRSIWL